MGHLLLQLVTVANDGVRLSLEREKSEITPVFSIPGDLGSKYLILGSRIYVKVSSFYLVLHVFVLRTYWQVVLLKMIVGVRNSLV